MAVLLLVAGCRKHDPKGEFIGVQAEGSAHAQPRAAASAQVRSARPADPTPQASASASSSAPVPAPVPSDAVPVRLREQDLAAILEKTTLTDALDYARPSIADAKDDWDRGTYLLGEWLAARGSWATVAVLPETSPPKISKDQEAEIGKRLCMAGTVTTIKAVRGSEAKLFWGILAPNETQAMIFLVAGDTGDIVDNSPGRVCGLATGIYHLTLKTGAPFPTPKVVGFFDLPKNKKK